MGLTWWLTPKGVPIRDEIARMTVAALPELNLDVDDTAKLIENVLQDHGDDRQAFNWTSYTRAATLLDARSVPEGQLASTIWTWIEAEARAGVTEWLVVVPLPRVQSDSVDIGYDGLSLLKASDADTWRSIAAEFDRASEWNPATGTDDGPGRLFRTGPIATWALCRVVGTSDVAKAMARERFRTLIALLFAHEVAREPALLLKKRG